MKWFWRGLFGGIIGAIGGLIDYAFGYNTSPILWGALGMVVINLFVAHAELDSHR